MISDSDPFIDGLFRWCSTHGIQIDARIRVARGEDGSICVVARDGYIEPRTTLVSIPKSAVLSIKSCTLAEHVPQVTYGKEAQLGLALALYGELLKGSSSPWFGYLESLPKHVILPLFWDDASEDEKSALSWIKGTMVEAEMSKSGPSNTSDSGDLSKLFITDLLHYFEFTALPALANANLGDHATIEGFNHAYSLVSSRSFIVDVYHGLAMVPIADAFNHNLENQVHLESDHEVCRLCGSLNECSHDTKDEESSEHAPSPPSIAADTFENTCDMVTNAPILPFTQVFNTYGEHLTNAQLLVRYGFVLDVNENDVLAWNYSNLCYFADSFGSSTDIVEKHDDGSCTSQSRAPASNILEGMASEVRATNECLGTSHFRLKHEDPTRQQTSTDQGNTVSVPTLGQFLLQRLEEVLELWDCENATFADSDLIYLPGNTRTETNTRIYDSRMGASNEVASRISAPSWSRKRMQLYFTLDGETRISHHLWIFCVLLALHARRPCFNISAGAVCRERSETEPSFSVPKRDEDERDGIFHECTSQVRVLGTHLHANCHSEMDMAPAKCTSVVEDITILKQALFIQKLLENLDSNSQAEMSCDDTEEARSAFAASPSRNVATDSGNFNVKNLVSIAKERKRDSEALSTPFIGTSQQYEEYPIRPRKRARSRSIVLNQSERRRQRIRAREYELTDVKEFLETGEAFEGTCEDKNINKTEKQISALSTRGTSRQGQKTDDGLLSALLYDYYDESDDITHSGSDSEIELLSAAGGGDLGQRNQHQESRAGTTSLAGMDMRNYPGRGSVARQPQKEENISDSHHRQYVPILLSSGNDTEDTHRRTDTEHQSFDSSGTHTGGPISKLAHDKNVPENACLDVLQLVASAARVVCALCAARSHDMAYPNLDAAELGYIADDIPPQMVQARMAAQLALEERVRLQGCIAGWSEIERAALQSSHRGSTAGG